MQHLFTSESVSAGHPDKMADQVSDAILDACLVQDKYSRVACEVFISRGYLVIGGEISTKAWVNFEEIARKVVYDIGYTSTEYGIDAKSMAVLVSIGQQSQDIAKGVDAHGKIKLGAGDQGTMFGYACNETKELMPAPLMLSHNILQYAYKQAQIDKELYWLRPDAKCQVTIYYEDNVPKYAETVVLSHQHNDEKNGKKLLHSYIRKTLIEKIIKPVLGPTGYLDKKTKFYINPTGRFVIGGPYADTGLTGRKTAVDSYGGICGHGGGAFSGKDPSKVDRSASYMARYLAKNIVAAKLADKCVIQFAYSIGVDVPVSIYVNTYGTSVLPDSTLAHIITKVVDTTPAGIIEKLDLLRPIYKKTAVFGHFGRNDKDFLWEKTNLVQTLLSKV